MCGIMGYLCQPKTLSIEQRAILTAFLAVQNDRRGGDSCGWFTPKGGLKKEVGTISEHVSEIGAPNFLFAHTRKATTGAINKDNAHPFEIGPIIGAHNGIISNHRELNEKYKRNFEVDSMHIFAHINENLDMSEISGYGAIEYMYRSKAGEAYLCKMTGGELAIFGIGDSVKSCQGVIWSSDVDHIKMAIKVAGIKAFAYTVKPGIVYIVRADGIYEAQKKIEISSNTTRRWQNGKGETNQHDYHNFYNRSFGADSSAETSSSIIIPDEDEKELDELIAAFKAKENGELAEETVTPAGTEAKFIPIVEGEVISSIEVQKP